MKSIIKLVVFILMATSIPTAKAQTKKSKDVYLLTYFRQRYPTRIEIDAATGKTIEVPLPNPMLIAKLHIALSNRRPSLDTHKR